MYYNLMFIFFYFFGKSTVQYEQIIFKKIAKTVTKHIVLLNKHNQNHALKK